MVRSFFNIVLGLSLLLSISGKAQPGIFSPGDYRDGVYDKENAVNRRFIPYTHLREADVTWEKRVWRQIDMREKINQPLYFPIDPDPAQTRISFLQVLVKTLLRGEMYAFTDETFMVPMEKSQLRDKLVIPGDTVEQPQYDEAGNETIVRVASPADSNWMYVNFATIDIKEDWFFDKQKSTLEVRILGLGINAYKKGKEDAGPIPQFWVYFPACRPFLAKNEVFNTKNDSERRTYDDIFWKRQFSSKIYKESNVYDREIAFYTKGIDALLESDRIKGDIFRWEHDLWQF